MNSIEKKLQLIGEIAELRMQQHSSMPPLIRSLYKELIEEKEKRYVELDRGSKHE